MNDTNDTFITMQELEILLNLTFIKVMRLHKQLTALDDVLFQKQLMEFVEKPVDDAITYVQNWLKAHARQQGH